MNTKDFQIIDGDKNIYDCHIEDLFIKDNKMYLVYSREEFNDDGFTKVYGARLQETDNGIIYIPLTEEEENMINKEWSEKYGNKLGK